MAVKVLNTKFCSLLKQHRCIDSKLPSNLPLLIQFTVVPHYSKSLTNDKILLRTKLRILVRWAFFMESINEEKKKIVLNL